MPKVQIKAGLVYLTANEKNKAGVNLADVTQVGATAVGTYVLTLPSAPAVANFAVGAALTYNSKGTNNHTADNDLVVTQVNGAMKYTCTGPWPVNN